ncbi:hypothetical protein PybrP1_011102 [[Pythium] brassicae (nom. inval.)]|nr:hypothetical protein PybrP1_011102 [[Pythium] brassicae (nom. inval.)]
MGAVSSTTSSSEAFTSARERAAFEKIAGRAPVAREDGAYAAVLAASPPLSTLSQAQLEQLNREFGAANSLESGNFRVLVRYAVLALPLSVRVDRMTPEEFAAHASAPDGARKSVESHVTHALNALCLVRLLTMRFVEKQDECALLAHFNRQPPSEDWATIVSPRRREAAKEAYDDLASRFLETLVTVLIDFPPTARTYDLHVEIVNTLLVLLSPVAFPRDHSKAASDVRVHNSFLHMLMASGAAGGAHTKKTAANWAPGIVQRLLQNFIDQLQSPPASRDSRAVHVARQNAHDMSLIKISEAADSAEEDEHFSYLTLDGLGSIATSIFRFPLSFYQYFVANGAHACPLADRSVLLLLVLLQSCRDDERVRNPFRDALSRVTNSETTNATAAEAETTSGDAALALSLPFSQLFAAIGRTAPYEVSHLLLYTLLYTNRRLHAAALAHRDLERLLLPLLETLYHARSVAPSRLYLLVIVLLTFTQDAAFVRAAHTKVVVRAVPWYSERYILDVSLGSLCVVIFTRLVLRNITHLQDSFLHLNAFAALANLARSAENLHVYAAQGLVGLIELLAKKEAQLAKKEAQLARKAASPLPPPPTTQADDDAAEGDDVLLQKRAAYVEFVRLLLGVVSSCLKAPLLPRNPQLIYAILYRAETFAALEQHPEFAHHVCNGPVWATLARFRAVVEAKTAPDDVLDVDTVLGLIRAECVSMLAASAAASGVAGPRSSSSSSSSSGRRPSGADALLEDEDASYRYEEEACPEQFFVPYVWQLVFEQTPDFCWKEDKITLFAPRRPRAATE